MKPAVLLCSLAATILLPAAAQAASFDCAKAKTKFERLVCATPALSHADEELASVYRARLKDFPIPEFIRDSQRGWLASAAECPPDPSFCLSMYRERIADLTAFANPKVYAKYGKKFDHDDVTLVLTTRNGALCLSWYGDWMPDAYRPKPFPDGFLAQDGGQLIKSGDHYTLADYPDAIITISDAKIVFGGDGMMLTARQAPIKGAFSRAP